MTENNNDAQQASAPNAAAVPATPAPAPQSAPRPGERGAQNQFGRNQRGGGGGPRDGGRGGRGGRGGGRGDRKEPSEYAEEVIQIKRVTRVVKGGRRLRFRATVVVGNKKGKIGVGVGKSVEVAVAIQKAISDAKKHMVIVKIVNETIPHQVSHKFKRAEIILMPARAGTGLKAGGSVRTVLELVGVKNILSKMIGCRNKLTNAQATLQALSSFKSL